MSSSFLKKERRMAYKKVLNKKSNRNRFAIPVYIDGIRYESLLSGAIDFELGYPNVFNKYKKNQGAPYKVSGHLIVTVNGQICILNLMLMPEFYRKEIKTNERLKPSLFAGPFDKER